MTYIKQFRCCGKRGLLTGWLPAPEADLQRGCPHREGINLSISLQSNWVDPKPPILCFNSSTLASRVTGTDLNGFRLSSLL